MLESVFKKLVIDELEAMYPEAIILKNDAGSLQGIADLLILFGNTWAALEFKKSKHAPRRPNQDYYIEKLDGMSYATYIYPENKDEVYDAIQSTFGSHRNARFPKRI